MTHRRPPLLLASQPWRDAAFQPLHETHEHDAHHRDRYHRHEGTVHPEYVAVLNDEIAEAHETDQELRDDHADEAPADRESDARQNERRRRRQDHVGPEPPLARVECARHLEEAAVDIADALLRVDEHREDAEQRDRRHARRVTLVLEDESDDRNERDRRHRVERAHQRIEGIERCPPTAGHDPEKHADHDRDGKPTDERAKTFHERVLQLAGLHELDERDRDRRWRPDDQRVPAGREELPHQKHDGDGAEPDGPVPHPGREASAADGGRGAGLRLADAHAAGRSSTRREQRSRSSTKRSWAITEAIVRGRSMSTEMISRTRAGRDESTTTRSPSAMASSMECVMNTIVRGRSW